MTYSTSMYLTQLFKLSKFIILVNYAGNCLADKAVTSEARSVLQYMSTRVRKQYRQTDN